MPGTDGLELIARICKTRPDMPVAVVSANLQDEIVARARELNAGFVPKPLTDESLGAFLSGAALRLGKRTMNIDVGELTGIEHDALAEIANIGVSRAANSLRQMVGEQVLLSVPPSISSRARPPRRSWNDMQRNWWPCSNRSRGRSPARRF